MGIYVDERPDWAEVADILRDAYRRIAPKRLLAQLDAAGERERDATDRQLGHLSATDLRSLISLLAIARAGA